MGRISPLVCKAFLPRYAKDTANARYKEIQGWRSKHSVVLCLVNVGNLMQRAEPMPQMWVLPAVAPSIVPITNNVNFIIYNFKPPEE